MKINSGEDEEEIVLDLSIVKEEYCIQEESPIEFNCYNGTFQSQDTCQPESFPKIAEAETSVLASQSHDPSQPGTCWKTTKVESNFEASDKTFEFAHMLEALIPIAESIVNQEEGYKNLAFGSNVVNYDKICFGKMKIKQEEEEEDEFHLDLTIVKEEQCVQEYSACIDIEAFPKSPQHELVLEAIIPKTEANDYPGEEYVGLNSEPTTEDWFRIEQIDEGSTSGLDYDDRTLDVETFDEPPKQPEIPPIDSHPLFLCQYCGICYGKSHLLKRHSKTCRRLHKKNITEYYVCATCAKRFRRKSHLADHVLTHIKNRPTQKCDLCERSYKIGSSFRAHKSKCRLKLWQAIPSPRIISMREKKLTKSSEKQKQVLQSVTIPQILLSDSTHAKNKVSAPKNLPETVVRESSETQTEKQGDPYECRSCGKKFKYQQTWWEHEVTHLEDRPYIPCEKCGEAFLMGSPYRIHLSKCKLSVRLNGVSQNSNIKQEKEFNDLQVQECQEGNYSLAEYLRRTESEVTETTEPEKSIPDEPEQSESTDPQKVVRTRKCSSCDKTFNGGQSLLEHELTHIRNRPSVSCKKCGRALLIGSSLRRHVQTCVGSFDYESYIQDLDPTYQNIFRNLQRISKLKPGYPKSTKATEHEKSQPTEYEEEQPTEYEEEQLTEYEEAQPTEYEEEQPTEYEEAQPSEHEEDQSAEYEEVQSIEFEEEQSMELDEAQAVEYNESLINELREMGRVFKCRTCGYMFKTRQSWMEHEFIHIKNRPSVPCKICGQAFVIGSNLRKHWRKCVGHFDYVSLARDLGPEYEELFRDLLTSKPFISQESNSDHIEHPMLIKKEELQPTEFKSMGNILKCRTCNKIFKNKPKLKEHELTHDNNRPRVPCKKCGAVYLLGSSLRIHMQQCIGRLGRRRRRAKKRKLRTVQQEKLKNIKKFHEASSNALEVSRGNTSHPELVTEELKPSESKESPSFKCSTCDKVFPFKGTLMEHEIIHIENRPRIPCKRCGVLYLMGSSLRIHQQKCFKNHGKGRVLSRNIQRAQEKKIIKQEEEKMRPVIPEAIQKILEETIPEVDEDLTCSTCGKFFKTKQSWKEHSFIHLENRPRVRCAKCGVSALLGSPFRIHVQKCYGKERFWKHPKNIIPDQKKSLRNLLTKIEETNGGYPEESSGSQQQIWEMPQTSTSPSEAQTVPEATNEFKRKIFECGYCWKVCYRKDNLAHHIVTHLKHRSYVTCELCGIELLESSVRAHKVRCTVDSQNSTKRRRRRRRVKKHIGSSKRIPIKVKSKMFTCDNCGKHFKLNHFLRMHLKTCGQTQTVPRNDSEPVEQTNEQVDENEMKHKCSTCGKAFKRKQAWKEHEIIHLKARPLLKCGKCGVSYLMGSPFRKHMAKCTGRPKRGTPMEKLNGLRKNIQIQKHRQTPSSPAKKVSNRSKEAIAIKKGYIHKCSTCGKRYQKRLECTEHELTHLHQNRPLSKCDKCGVSYFMGAYFRRHKRMCDGQPRRGTLLVAQEEKQLENDVVESPTTSCDVSQAVQTKSDGLESSEDSNRKHKKLINECSTCGKRFLTLQKLKDHELTHLENRPLAKCPKCGVSYLVGSYQRKHVKMCNGKPGRGTHPQNMTLLKTIKSEVKEAQEPNSPKTVPKSPKQSKVRRTKIVRKQLKEIKRIHNIPIHKCSTCGKGFARPQLLKDHEFIHLKNRPLTKCEKCGVEYLMGSYLRRHLTKCNGQPGRGTLPTHLEQIKSVLQQRSKSGSSPLKRVQSHGSRVKNQNMYKCSTCGKAFRQLLQYTEHKLIHLKDRPLTKCTSCGVSYLMGSSFRRHMTQCKGNQMRGSPQNRIDDHQNTGSTLNDHQPTSSSSTMAVREPERAVKCAICAKIFQQKDQLTAHMNTHVHLKNSSLIPCENCGIPYLESYLRMHRKICHGPTEVPLPLAPVEVPVTQRPQEPKKKTKKPNSKKYECQVCFKIFGDRITLRNHKRIHKESPPELSCGKCGVVFTWRQSLQRHKKKNKCQPKRNDESVVFTIQVVNDANQEQ